MFKVFKERNDKEEHRERMGMTTRSSLAEGAEAGIFHCLLLNYFSNSLRIFPIFQTRAAPCAKDLGEMPAK